MSLINDALQRAKHQTATQSVPTPNLQLRPAEPVVEQKAGKSRLILFAFIGVLILAGATLPALLRRQPAGTVPSTIASNPASIPATLTSETPGPEPSMQAAVPAPEAPIESAAISTTETPPPAPTPPKLNGILFHSSRPSAIVGGKTVYVNGRVGEFRVASITQTNVVLASERETVVLSFEE